MVWCADNVVYLPQLSIRPGRTGPQDTAQSVPGPYPLARPDIVDALLAVLGADQRAAGQAAQLVEPGPPQVRAPDAIGPVGTEAVDPGPVGQLDLQVVTAVAYQVLLVHRPEQSGRALDADPARVGERGGDDRPLRARVSAGLLVDPGGSGPGLAEPPAGHDQPDLPLQVGAGRAVPVALAGGQLHPLAAARGDCLGVAVPGVVRGKLLVPGIRPPVAHPLPGTLGGQPAAQLLLALDRPAPPVVRQLEPGRGLHHNAQCSTCGHRTTLVYAQ